MYFLPMRKHVSLKYSLCHWRALSLFVCFTVTRSHKLNGRDHVSSDGTSISQEHVPRYFGKSGPVDGDPKKTKKDGGGKGNWGRSGDEVQDYGYNFTKARRRSNSSNQGLVDFKTKFETIEAEPVFEEELYRSLDEQVDKDSMSKIESADSSTSGGSSIMERKK